MKYNKPDLNIVSFSTSDIVSASSEDLKISGNVEGNDDRSTFSSLFE